MTVQLGESTPSRLTTVASRDQPHISKLQTSAWSFIQRFYCNPLLCNMAKDGSFVLGSMPPPPPHTHMVK